MDTFNGYLFAKLFNIGTKSEGPEYFLQQRLDQGKIEETQIHKKSHLWEIDPTLHQFIAQKVTIGGVLKDNTIQYEQINFWEPFPPPPPHELKLTHKIEGQFYYEVDGVLLIDKQPPLLNAPPPPLRKLNITLLVQWPYRSIWHGQCSTSQLYDFFIEDPQGKVIWQWSKCILFAKKNTSVNIYGGTPIEFPVTWYYFDEAIEKIGLYTIRAMFLPTSQEITKGIEIKLAQ